MFKCFCLFRVFYVFGFLGFGVFPSFLYVFFCGLWLQQVRRGNVPDPLSETHLTRGFVDFSRLLRATNSEGAERQAVTEDEVIYVVTTTCASSFATLFDKDHPEVAMRVRAYQGHSGGGADLINDEVAHKRLTIFDCGTGVCVHSTSFEALASMLTTEFEVWVDCRQTAHRGAAGTSTARNTHSATSE